MGSLLGIARGVMMVLGVLATLAGGVAGITQSCQGSGSAPRVEAAAEGAGPGRVPSSVNTPVTVYAPVTVNAPLTVQPTVNTPVQPVVNAPIIVQLPAPAAVPPGDDGLRKRMPARDVRDGEPQDKAKLKNTFWDGKQVETPTAAVEPPLEPRVTCDRLDVGYFSSWPAECQDRFKKVNRGSLEAETKLQRELRGE